MLKRLIMPLILVFIIFGYGCIKDNEDETEKDKVMIIESENGIEVKATEDLEGLSFTFNQNIDKTKVEISGVDLNIIKDNKIALAGGIEKDEIVLKIEDFTIGDIDLDSIEFISKADANYRAIKREEDINPILLGDFNSDGEVGISDYTLFAANYFMDSSMEGFDVTYDIGPANMRNEGLWDGIYAYSFPDGEVGLFDFVVFASNYFKTYPTLGGNGSITGTYNITNFEAGVVRVFVVEENENGMFEDEIQHIDIPASLAELNITDLPTYRRLAVEIDIPGYYIKKFHDINLTDEDPIKDLGEIIFNPKGVGVIRGSIAQTVSKGHVNVYRETGYDWEYLGSAEINTVDSTFEVGELPVGDALIVEINAEGYHTWRDEGIIIPDTNLFEFANPIELIPYGSKQLNITIGNPGVVDGGMRVTVYQIISETEEIYISEEYLYDPGMDYFDIRGLDTGEYRLVIEGEGFDPTILMTGIGADQEYSETTVTLIPGIEITAPIKNILEQGELPHFEWRSGNTMVNSYVVGVIRASNMTSMDDIQGPEAFDTALMAFDASSIEIVDDGTSDYRTFAWDYTEKTKDTTQVFDFALPLEERVGYIYLIMGFEESLETIQTMVETNAEELEPISFGEGEENFFIQRGATVGTTSLQINNPNNIFIEDGSEITYYMFKLPTETNVEFNPEQVIAADQMVAVSDALYIDDTETALTDPNLQLIDNVLLMDPIVKESVTDQYAVIVEIDKRMGEYNNPVFGATLLEFTGTENILTEPIEVNLGVVPDILINFLDKDEDNNVIEGPIKVIEDEESFRAELTNMQTVNFDTYPNGDTVPIGYDQTGEMSGFTLAGDEWAGLGVTFSTPSGQDMTTVSITEFPETDIHDNYVSAPNSLTIGQPPFVGYGVEHGTYTEDSLDINFTNPVDGFGLYFIDSSGVDGERIELYDADNKIIGKVPADYGIYFIGIVSEVPIASVKIYEDANDEDDVSYDDIIFGTK